MPVKHIQRSIPANQYYRNTSYETLAASWFTFDGWEVFIPATDHDMKTDLLVSDGLNYYRIQIKTVDTIDDTILVNNMWRDKKIDYVIYFSTQSTWGYIAKAFHTIFCHAHSFISMIWTLIPDNLTTRDCQNGAFF
jgi:hypothetical protein